MYSLNRLNNYIKTSIFIGVFIVLASCENDIKEVIELSTNEEQAILTAVNVELTYSTHGEYKARMEAPLLKRFIKDKDKVELEFPEGVKMFFYDNDGVVTSSIRANYSIYYETEGIWEARKDVEALNKKGEKLNTEYLIWNREKATISSNEFVKITTDEGVLYGDGFVSDQEFNKWEIKKGRGVFNIETNE